MPDPIGHRGPEIERVVLAYAAAWNEDDPWKLRDLLDACWALDGIVQSNFEEIAGREALHARISNWRRDVPGCRAILTSGIEHPRDLFRFTAIVARPNGELFSPALDIGEIDGDGRNKRIITFYLDLPPPPAHWPKSLVPDAAPR